MFEPPFGLLTWGDSARAAFDTPNIRIESVVAQTATEVMGRSSNPSSLQRFNRALTAQLSRVARSLRSLGSTMPAAPP